MPRKRKTPAKFTRRDGSLCRPMPLFLTYDDVVEWHDWPLRPSHKRQKRFAGACDVVLFFVEDIRTGSRYNCRRVWYDGQLYIKYRGRRVVLRGGLMLDVADIVTDVCGRGVD